MECMHPATKPCMCMACVGGAIGTSSADVAPFCDKQLTSWYLRALDSAGQSSSTCSYNATIYDNDPNVSQCPTTSPLGLVMLAVYVLLVNVLLINLLIAMFRYKNFTRPISFFWPIARMQFPMVRVVRSNSRPTDRTDCMHAAYIKQNKSCLDS